MKICSECQRCYDDAVEECAQFHGPLAASRLGGVSMIRGYRIEERLYTGLRSELFRANRTDCGRSCLIRLISAGAETEAHFLNEAKLVAELFHPNLSAVYESGTTDSGELFVVSEDIEACETLRSRLDRDGSPELLESIHIVRVAAEILHELHQAGVIHRAVSPENILISTDHSGETHVRLQNIDLGGIAQSSVISNRFLIDTEIAAIRYFAPEQCSGEPATARSDVYSLGILLYELIAGAPPFDADRASGVIEQHRHSRPPDIKIDNFDLRMLISHTLMESLNKHADRRQASADIFARQLRHIEQLATHVSTPPPVVSVASQPVAKQVPRMVSLPEKDLDLPAINGLPAVVESTNASQPEPPVELDHGALAEPEPYAKIDPDKIKQIDFRAAREQMQELLAAKPAPLTSETPPEPKLIRWDGPLDDIPSVEDALDVLQAEGNLSPAFEPLVEQFEEPGQGATLIVDDELWVEEIADDRSRAGGALIELDVEGIGSPAPVIDRITHFGSDGELFASVHGLSAARFGRLRRGIAVGAVAGLIALAFAFRGNIADAFTPFDLGQLHPSQPQAATTSAPVAVHQEADTVYTPPVQNEAAQPALATVEPPPSTIRINEAGKKPSERSVLREEPAMTRRPGEKIRAQTKPQPIQPSTLVITYPDPKKVGAERTKERNPFVAPRSGTGLTRPRIVANPKP